MRDDLNDHETHETVIRVRYAETDAMGVMHHANYFTYFETARTELYRDSGGNYREFENNGYYFVIIEAQCKYRLPALYDDVLKIQTHLKQRTSVKLVHEYKVYRDHELLAEGKTVLACLNKDKKPCRIPEDIF